MLFEKLLKFFKSFFYFNYLLFFASGFLVHAQQTYSSSDILLGLKKLNVLGNVLYIAAHPDDENTAVLTYMSKSKLVNAAYLSLTRGGGGQNLIGSEKGDLLGVLRTQELLSARRIDGAQQFFTRAVDFGYSKSSYETLTKWNRDIILGDVVKVIRQFKPDIIITRFSRTNGGHGHHLASAILTEEAFYAAADSNMYPEQLKKLEVWQPKRVCWNTWKPSQNAVKIDVGAYNSILGQSYNEIAAQSRTMHKSQGFGVLPRRGTQLESFDMIVGDNFNTSLFDDIDISWSRINDGEKIGPSIIHAIKEFDYENPENSIPHLLDIYDEIENIEDGFWKEKKKDEIKNLIKECAGIWIESNSSTPSISPGDEIEITSKIVVRAGVLVKIKNVRLIPGGQNFDINAVLIPNTPLVEKHRVSTMENARYHQPFW